ncbi:hypothetical protein ACWGIV_18210 [Streptomyces sp. NPDC054844]
MDLKERVTAGLDWLSASLADGSADGVKVTTRKGKSCPCLHQYRPSAAGALHRPAGRRGLGD